MHGTERGKSERGALKRQWEAASEDIKGYHIHIYHGADREAERSAQRVAQEIGTLFPEFVERRAAIGAVGPHLSPNVVLHIKREGFGGIVSWLQFNGGGLSILIHPETGDDLRDHLEGSMWLGRQLGYNAGFFEKLRAGGKSGPGGP